MVYTVVLEATAARIESSSLSLGTNYGDEASMVMQWTVNPPPSGTPGSIPGISTMCCNVYGKTQCSPG